MVCFIFFNRIWKKEYNLVELYSDNLDMNWGVVNIGNDFKYYSLLYIFKNFIKIYIYLFF